MTLARLLPAAMLAVLLAASAAPRALAASDDAPAPSPDRPPVLRDQGRTLNIPGLPPIQLPPGARAFGPGVVDDDDVAPPPRRPRDRADEDRPADRPKAAEKQKQPPASVMPLQERRSALLDRLFKQLHDAPDPESAQGVASAIDRVWLQSGSDTADLLMSRAAQALAAKDTKLAEQVLDSVVDIQPDWAEGWNKRATLRFMTDDYAGAMADLERALKLEPRHFGALTGLGAILQKTGLDKRALEAYRRALDIYPEQPDLQKAVEKLRLEVEGRDI